jgi:hypothetical protein
MGQRPRAYTTWDKILAKEFAQWTTAT